MSYSSAAWQTMYGLASEPSPVASSPCSVTTNNVNAVDIAAGTTVGKNVSISAVGESLDINDVGPSIYGSVEGLGLLADRLALKGAFWGAVATLNDRFGMLGYLIVAIFAASWILSVLVYRLKGYDRLEPVTEFS